MNKHLQMGLILSMSVLSTNTFGQKNDLAPKTAKDDKIGSRSHFGILLNIVNTDLNYGASNTALAESRKSIKGVQVGVSYQAHITDRFSVVPELYFMMKGGQLKQDNPLTIQKSTLRFYTIESPVLARFSFGKAYLNAGPSIALNLFGSRKVGDESNTISFGHSSESFKRWDASIQFGGGYTFNTRQKSIALDVRYTYGLSNISFDREIYNRTVNVGVHVSNLRKPNSKVKHRN